jgi:hypothetical protein
MQTARFIVFALLLIPLTNSAQSIRGGAGFLFGGQSVWPGSANAVQQQSGSLGLTGTNQYALFGAETYFRSNRWLFGINASALVNKPIAVVGTQPRIESSASNAHLWVGWVAWQSKRAKLYPSLGPGINSFNINSTKSGRTPTTMTLDGFSTDFALTFDWLTTKPLIDQILMAGPMLSMRVGYRLTTGSAEWHSDSTTPTIVSPNRYVPRGFYITLGVGGGGFRQR